MIPRRRCPCGKAIKSLSGKHARCWACRQTARFREHDLPGWKIEQQLTALAQARRAKRVRCAW